MYSIRDIKQLVLSKEKSIEDICHKYLNQIEQTNNSLNAYITYTRNYAIEHSKTLDNELSFNKSIGSLAGVPFAVKDNIMVKDLKMTCASEFLRDFTAPYTATAVQRLIDAGAVLLGKTNLDEFAMGSLNEYSAFGECKNPINTAYSPGGSSGGSAVAVKSGMACFALGSDTGGSARLPAAFCGVFGLKPSYGAVSRYGLTAFASSLDQIGILANSSDDIKQVFEVISGYDEHDFTSVDYHFQKTLDEQEPIIGIPLEYYENLSPEMKELCEEYLSSLRNKGFKLIKLSLPLTRYALSAYMIISSAEAFSNLGRYDGVRYSKRTESPSSVQEMFVKSRSEGFGTEVKKRVMLGAYILQKEYYDSYYLKAMKLKENISMEFDQTFTQCDFLLTPVSANISVKLNHHTDETIHTYKNDQLLCPANLGGIPALSFPIKTLESGFSFSMQLMGKKCSEYKLLDLSEHLI